jgi:hypothetical protein
VEQKPESKLVKVVCPICQQEKEVEIPIFLVNEAQDGMLKVQIPQGACCPEHSFMAFVDKKFKVRGYQNADIEFKAETAAPRSKMLDQGLKDFNVRDMVETLGPDVAGTMLRSVLVNRPVLMLDTFDLYNRVDKTVALLQDMDSDELLITCEKVTREELKDKRFRRARALVIVPLYKAIMKSPFLDDISTRFEVEVLQEAMKLPDRTSQIIFLRKELVKISKIIEEFVHLLKKTDKLYEEDVPAITHDKFNYKLDMKNVDVIKEVVSFKYDRKLADKIINKSLDKIRTDLW